MNQLAFYFSHLFSTEGLPPRWHCGLWPAFQGWFYILSDLGIWAAYFTIPLILLRFIHGRSDLPFPRIFWLFGAFIFACGTTHLLDALMFWWPAYRLTGLVYFATACISWATISALMPVIPQALALKSPTALENEIKERKQVENQLLNMNQALKVSEERFRLLVDGVKDYAIYRLDPQGYIQTWNQGAERLTGYVLAEIIGAHFSIFYSPESIAQEYPEYELKQARELGHFEDEGWRIRKDGKRFWANVIITALYDENNLMVGFTKIIRDLTEQRRFQESLQASEKKYRELSEAWQFQATQLGALNKELETFSYSVSHDLRAPLRGVDGFSQVLLDQYGDQLDERGKHYLKRIREGSQQMGRLIDDMLQLSRLTRSEMTMKTVNLSGIVQSIIQAFQEQQPERHVKFQVADNVMAQGDPYLLQAVMQNLLDNAMKYTSKHAQAHIEFGVTEKNGQPVYFVKDDGAGFDMSYAGKLFGAFQRLHGVAEFPGTGVGLATVSRIIHRHGGEIWAEAEIEKGATFYFTCGQILSNSEAEGGQHAVSYA